MSIGNMGVVGRGDFDAAQPGPQGPTGATGGLVTINKTAHGFTFGKMLGYKRFTLKMSLQYITRVLI